MTRDPAERRILPVLIAGFALLLVVLLVSGWVSVDSMRFVESDASRFVSEQQAAARLINEVQNEEGDLSAIFYSLATREDTNREQLLQRIDATLKNLEKTSAQLRTAAEEAGPQIPPLLERADDVVRDTGTLVDSVQQMWLFRSDTARPAAPRLLLGDSHE